jgi:peptide/nickel transport system permease protein
MTFNLLWTDKFFLSLLVFVLFMAIVSLRKQHIRVSFSKILQKPVAASAGVVLLFFLAIGVLDSIHFQAEPNGSEATVSFIDTILSPIGSIYEKTYSAPLALTMFVSETEIVNGIKKQIYPRLNYPPQAIKTSLDKNAIIKVTMWHAILFGILLSLCFWLLSVFIKIIVHYIFPSPQAWGEGASFYLAKTTLSPSEVSALITAGILSFLVVWGYELSRSFHLLGTGQIGQDMFYFTVKSIRTGLIIGFLTTLFMLPLALFLGIGAGYFGGIIDDIIQYIYTTLSSIPGILLITASVLSLQTYITSHPEQFNTLAKSADARLLALCLILGVTSWTSLCRLLRAETLKLREVDYVIAAKALGSGWFTIIRKHLLPNVMHIVIITLVLDFSFLVLAEAVLSYVGVGVSPMTISWGNMINGARLELARDPIVWWPMFSAFLLMFILVLSINLFADAVRDAFDPRQSE